MAVSETIEKEIVAAQAKRLPVDYRYDALNWEFIKLLAEIADYAGKKYGTPGQYTKGRLEGNQSPVNHIVEHTRMYLMDEPHDHFGLLKYQLAAIAYNAMMEYYYLESTGPTAKHLFDLNPLIETDKYNFNFPQEVSVLQQSNDTPTHKLLQFLKSKTK